MRGSALTCEDPNLSLSAFCTAFPQDTERGQGGDPDLEETTASQCSRRLRICVFQEGSPAQRADAPFPGSHRRRGRAGVQTRGHGSPGTRSALGVPGGLRGGRGRGVARKGRREDLRKPWPWGRAGSCGRVSGHRCSWSLSAPSRRTRVSPVRSDSGRPRDTRSGRELRRGARSPGFKSQLGHCPSA